MKKIVLKESKTVSIEAIDNDSFVGILWKEGDKGYLMSSERGYFGLVKSDLTLDGVFYEPTKERYVKRIMKNLHTAYLFDTKEELFTWFYKE